MSCVPVQEWGGTRVLVHPSPATIQPQPHAKKGHASPIPDLWLSHGSSMGSLAWIHIETWGNREADRPSTSSVIKNSGRKFQGSPALAGGAISILAGAQDQAGKCLNQPHPVPGLPWAESGARDSQVPPGPTMLLKQIAVMWPWSQVSMVGQLTIGRQGAVLINLFANKFSCSHELERLLALQFAARESKAVVWMLGSKGK